ncbi:MAG: septal ring lytic transglycosylase RlpA family protein [Nitrospirae bacterium]|nr:septal ring lytic transglycosylase RlpA family protein [Nitrospirota bacterium]
MVRNMKRHLILLILLAFLGACSGGRVEVRVPPQPLIPPEGKTTMVASWYGKKFHGRPTASGEIFNMYGHTAAHKSLPFGTLLRVTNPANGRSVVVKINDRGPFVKGRDLDLSYGAAKQLGLIQKGTSVVYVDFIGRDNRYIRQVKYVATEGPYTIQIASFNDPINAFRLKRILKYSYDNVYIMKVRVNGALYYRVRIGRFPSRSFAENIARRLAQEGYSVMITSYEEVS